ncbi:hypothetical protein HPP92_017822 [Vanilla planifolia]|uniref:60S ribosomal protein L31 n=1 Tax=Vanilla planifolia TaxID=51239 RepID=A0A835QEF8_VANPL|nr:hypothetical protein HPP92_017822 [Vanilla planifolia]
MASFLAHFTFKKKAPKAIKEIRKFAQKAMGTTDVRIDVKVNKQIWSRGIRSVPRRVAVTREYTINLHKRLHGCTFKKKAPKAIKEIRKFAQKAMGTTDVRIDVKRYSQCPKASTVRIARKRNEEEDAKEEFYSLVTVAEVPPEGLKGLGTKVIDDAD